MDFTITIRWDNTAMRKEILEAVKTVNSYVRGELISTKVINNGGEEKQYTGIDSIDDASIGFVVKYKR